MAQVGYNKGIGTDMYPGGIVDSSGNTWTLSAAAHVAGVGGFAVNLNGADTAFPLNRCAQLWYSENGGTMSGKQNKGGWYEYIGGAWVLTRNKRDY